MVIYMAVAHCVKSLKSWSGLLAGAAALAVAVSLDY